MGDTYTEQLVKRKNTGKTMVEKIALILLTIGIFVLGMMIPLLELVYGVELQSVKSSFLILIIAGCFTSMNSILSYIFTVVRKQKFMNYIYVVAMIVAQVMVKALTVKYGIFGASLDYLIGIASITIMFIIGLVLVLKSDKGEKNE